MALSKTPKLFVIARNSTFAYKDKPINIKQAAKELGVRYILEGSVQKTENRVRITAQLIEAEKGQPSVGRTVCPGVERAVRTPGQIIFMLI